MKFLTFSRQAWLCVIVFVACMVLSFTLHQGIFHNVAWVFYGALFFVHPVWPKSVDWQDHRKLRLGIRIGAALCIVVGLITRFGA